MEITEMISDEEERVALVHKINPQAANVSFSPCFTNSHY